MTAQENNDSAGKSTTAPQYRVLLVEDEPINQQILEAFLRRLGCSVELAGNGMEALAAASKERFDLIFMDIQMPVMDGMEASRKLRSQDEYSQNMDTPVIALSGCAIPGDQATWQNSGITDHLAKPVTLNSLGDILKLYLGS